MRIVVGYIDDGTPNPPSLVIHADHKEWVIDPKNPDKWLSCVEFIAKLNESSEIREKAGWHALSQHPSESEPKHLWDRLVEHTNGPDGHPELKQLNLKK